MGRKKSDSPTLFPWDKIFSDDENTFNEGIEYCKSEYNGSENLKRAVTAIGSGYNSGSKSVLCERIKQKAIQIRYQIDKETNPNKRGKLRDDVINYYTATFLKKFEGKEEGIKNIAIPPRPNLPLLTEQEKKKYASPPSSPRTSPPSSPRYYAREEPVIEEEFVLQEPIVVNDNTLLSARAIIYYKDAPIVNNKKSISAKTFYEQLQVLYKGIVPDNSVLLSKESIKNEITQLPTIIKNAGGLKKDLIDRSQAIIDKSESMKKYQRQIIIEEEEEIIVPPPRVEPRIEAPRVEVPRIEIPQESYKSTVSEDDIINYIKTKGWEEPKYKSKEALCDYVLKQIKGEDVRAEDEYKSIESRIDKLSDNLLALLDMHEQRIKELEKAKKSGKKKVKFGASQIKVIEEEAEEIEQQIHDVKEQLQEAKENKEQLEEQIEEKKQMCFKMRQWLDQDEFDRVEAEKDLICDNGGDFCNIDSGICEPSKEGEYTSTIGIAKIKGSKDIVDKMYNKYTNIPVQPIIEEEEIIVPVVKKVVKPKKAQIVPSEAIRQQVKLILSTSDLETVSPKDIREELEIFFGVDLDKRKKEINVIITEEYNKIKESKQPVIEEEEIIVPITKAKKPRIPTETLREQVKLILSTADLDIITSDDVVSDLSMIFRVKLDKRKEEINRLFQEEKEKILESRKPVIEEEEISLGEELPEEEEISLGEELPEEEEISLGEELPEEVPKITEKDIVEKTVELLELAGKSIKENEIRTKVAEYFNIDVEPYKPIIKTTIKNFVKELKDKRKKCNTIPLDQDVDEISRAKDLMCDEGDACNLDESRCDPIEEAENPVEELTIGGMLVKVTGKNKIVEALKQKIIKSGGAIPVESEEPIVESVSEPIISEEEKPLSEVIEGSESGVEKDIFQSKLPGVRINLEDLIKNIKSISKTPIMTSAQNKIKSAERKCIERIAKCAGIKI